MDDNPSEEFVGPFLVEIVSDFPAVQRFIAEVVLKALADPLVDATVERILQEKNGVSDATGHQAL